MEMTIFHSGCGELAKQSTRIVGGQPADKGKIKVYIKITNN